MRRRRSLTRPARDVDVDGLQLCCVLAASGRIGIGVPQSFDAGDLATRQRIHCGPVHLDVVALGFHSVDGHDALSPPQRCLRPEQALRVRGNVCLAHHGRGTFGVGDQLSRRLGHQTSLEQDEYQIDDRGDDVTQRAVYRVPERHRGSDDEHDHDPDPTQRRVLVRRRAQCSAVVHDRRCQGVVADAVATSRGGDHRHPLCTGQVVGARPVPDHPALHPEAAPDAEDEDDDAGNQHPGVQPSQHAKEQARTHPPSRLVGRDRPATRRPAP